MNKISLSLALTLILLISACQVFLGADPDNSPMGIFDCIWTDFNETYALFEVKGIDWYDAYNRFSPQISADMEDRDLFNVCANMLKILDDSHVRLSSPFALSNSGGKLDKLNSEPFSIDVVRLYLNDGGITTDGGMFVYGTFSSMPNVGYIYIAAFAHGFVGVAHQDWIKSIDGIVQSLANTDSLVLDIRGNTGGLPSNMNYIASRFASEKKNYAEVRTKNGPGRSDFSSPVVYTINPDGIKYTKPIVLLTNKQTISGGEWFTLALLSQDHVTHAGGITNGAFSLALERNLVNGWIYSVSVQKVTDMNGICYEGVGISPKNENIIHNTHVNIMSNIDDQLEYALSIFK